MYQEVLIRAIAITGVFISFAFLTINLYFPPPQLPPPSPASSHTFSKPLDTILSYSHHTLSSPTAFGSYIPLFFHPTPLFLQLFCALSLNMGFFGNHIPNWSPTPKGMMDARKEVSR